MKKAYIIQTDGSVHEVAGRVPALADIRKIVDGPVERVKVLRAKPGTKGYVAEMFVNETGAVSAGGRPALQPNARATLLYANATLQGRTGAGSEILTFPLIHGNAVLFDYPMEADRG